MIDKINARLRTSNLGKLDAIKPFRSGPRFRIYKFRNVQIAVHPFEDLTNMSYIYITGSIPKFLYKNNLRDTDILMVKRFIVLLKKMTGLPIDEFDVTSFELAANMNMLKEFRLYANTFEYAPRFSRSIKYAAKGTVDFRNKSKTLSLYDKGKEFEERQNAKGPIPFELSLKNLLRFEVRIKQYIPKLFTSMKIKDLYQKSTFAKFISLWEKYYFSIQKTPRPQLKFCTTPSDVKDYLLLKGLESIGGKDEFIKQVEGLRLQDTLTRRGVKSLIHSVDKALKSKVVVEQGDEVHELDEKIRWKARQLERQIR